MPACVQRDQEEALHHHQACAQVVVWQSVVLLPEVWLHSSWRSDTHLGASRSAKAQLIRVDPQSGALSFNHAVGRDIFDSEVGAAYVSMILTLPCRLGPT